MQDNQVGQQAGMGTVAAATVIALVRVRRGAAIACVFCVADTFRRRVDIDESADVMRVGRAVSSRHRADFRNAQQGLQQHDRRQKNRQLSLSVVGTEGIHEPTWRQRDCH